MIRIRIQNRRGPGGLPGGALRAIVAFSAACLGLSCIERGNPFDPINGGAVPASVVRNQLQGTLRALAAGESQYDSALSVFAEAFRKDSLANSVLIQANANQRAHNDFTATANAASETRNLAAVPDSLVDLQFFSLLDTLKAFGPYPDLELWRSTLQTKTATLTSFMAQTNSDHSPLLIYPSEFSDSVLSPFLRAGAAFDLLRTRVASGNAAVLDSNSLLRTYNREREAANASVKAYNDSIGFLRLSHNKPPLARADSVLAGAAGAQAGDTIFIAKGDYSVDLRFNHSGSAENPIVVRGFPGGRTVLRVPFHSSSAMILSANQDIQFQDIVFRGGVQLVAGCRRIVFQRCVFDSSTSYGLRVVDSDAGLVDCRLTQNANGAFIQGKTDESVTFSMKNVLLARNTGTGLVMNIPKGNIHNCTIADNGGDGVSVSVLHSGLSIFNSIISGNTGTGFTRQRDTEFQDKLDIQQCDVWGNKQADWSLQGMDSTLAADVLKANFSIPPDYVAPADLNYGLRPGSILAEYEHLSVPIFIGYRP